jgi:dTDP-glucose pyrophosphorylase
VIAGKALILARGLGSRMRAPDARAELDEAQRRVADAGLKAMLPFHGRPWLDFVLSELADAGLTDVAVIVAPEHDLVRRHYAGAPPDRVRLTWVVQPEARGTADAVLAAQGWAGHAPFLTLNADNIYPARALAALAALDEPGLLVFTADDLAASSNIPGDRIATFALIEFDAAGYLTRIVEKPGIRPAQVSMNCWRFDARIFAACRDVPRSARGEYELPEAVGLAIARGVRFRGVPAAGPVLDLSRRADAAEVARRLAGREPHP